MGDVGIVQRDLGGNDHFHMGLVPQRMLSYLETLDYFLCMPAEDVVLSSVVAADTHAADTQTSFTDDKAARIIADIIKIIGTLLIL